LFSEPTIVEFALVNILVLSEFVERLREYALQAGGRRFDACCAHKGPLTRGNTLRLGRRVPPVCLLHTQDLTVVVSLSAVPNSAGPEVGADVAGGEQVPQ